MATANPQPVIEWYRSDDKLTNISSQIEISQDGTMLSLLRVQENDRGQYICRARVTATDNGRTVVLADTAVYTLSVIGTKVQGE